jgi:hypothetical protein
MEGIETLAAAELVIVQEIPAVLALRTPELNSFVTQALDLFVTQAWVSTQITLAEALRH